MAIKVSKETGGKKQTFNEINITPLTDIFLVLLIIMMVIAPSFQSIDNNINMPEITSGTGIEELNANISVTKNGEIFLNSEKITLDTLEEKLALLVKENEAKEVIVRADKDAKSSEILNIMNAAQNAGYKKLVVAGEPLSKKEQEELEKSAE
ncbi:TPA: biopolymer transporter ExbD [Candidatus Galligastranaerophilus gallistercoris]|nr:biopolymer transporter ExbD [Candidatus Galligastranaerophilus gallistercoris]